MKHCATYNEAKKAKAKAPKVFGPLVGEVAVGIVRLGKENFGLKVNLTDAPEDDVSLPTEIDGVPIQVEVVGKIKKL